MGSFAQGTSWGTIEGLYDLVTGREEWRPNAQTTWRPPAADAACPWKALPVVRVVYVRQRGG